MERDEIMEGTGMRRDDCAPDGKLLEDQRLMRFVAIGDRRAKADLMRRLWRRVANMARYMSPYPDEAEDLAQEALLQILRAAARYQGTGCVEAWADVIASRTILKRLRRLHRLRLFGLSTLGVRGDEEEGHAGAEKLSAEGDLDGDIQSLARLERLRVVLAKVPADCRMALVLKHVYDYTTGEVAQAMGVSFDGARYLLRKGRSRLRVVASREPALAEIARGER